MNWYSIRIVHLIKLKLLCLCSFATIIEVIHPSKPLIIPEPYQGGDKWDVWVIQFENVATVNEWDAAAKLNLIKVCLARRAQKAF